MQKIELKINGQSYTGWQEISVVRSLEALCGRFDISVTDKRPFPIPRAGAVELLLRGKTIITGYTDSLSSEIAPREHKVRITGRDKTADLVDCSAEIDSQEMLNVTLKEIIEEIIAPFGIQTIFETLPAEPFKKFSFQEETAFEAIERACRLRGVLASSNESGAVVIQEYGRLRAGTGLRMGENVITARAVFNESDRFSKYVVYGQQPGDDFMGVAASTEPMGEARDLGVKRYRPKIIIAEGSVDETIAQDRAEWEATVRAARAVQIEVTVSGWLDSDGNLWRENRLARCYLPENGVNGDMLIKEVSFTLDDRGGEKTKLALVRPDAYQKQPDLKEEEMGLEYEF